MTLYSEHLTFDYGAGADCSPADPNSFQLLASRFARRENIQVGLYGQHVLCVQYVDQPNRLAWVDYEFPMPVRPAAYELFLMFAMKDPWDPWIEWNGKRTQDKDFTPTGGWTIDFQVKRFQCRLISDGSIKVANLRIGCNNGFPHLFLIDLIRK